VLVDYGTDESLRPVLDQVIHDAGVDVRLVHVENSTAPFSIGAARDIGARSATSPVVLFNDIDFIAPARIYRLLAEEITKSEIAKDYRQFFCVPVIFLHEEATSEYLETGNLLGHEKLACSEERARKAVFTSYGSSCMVSNREYYLDIGGHDSSFWGHGAEDFELLHRVFSEIPKGPRPPYYDIDFKDNGISNYRGFRAAFSLFGIQAFRRGLFMVHLYHPSRRERRYNRRREKNFQILRRKMKEFDCTGSHPPQARRSVLHTPNTMISLDSDVFESFGGRRGIERALEIASKRVGRSTGISFAAARAIVGAYALYARWGLTRRDRLLLRYAPSEYFAEHSTRHPIIEWARRHL
jgi:hypothetical protein